MTTLEAPARRRPPRRLVPQENVAAVYPRLVALATPGRLLAAVAVVGLVILLVAGRDTTYFRDDWYFVQYRDGRDATNLFSAHAGHLSVLPVLVYLGVFDWLGLDAYIVQRTFVALLAVAVSVLASLLIRERVGTPLSLVAALGLMTLGAGWDDLLWGFQIGFAAAMTAGLGALLILLGGGSARRHRVGASALLLVAVASGGLAIPFLAAAIVAVVADPQRRRRDLPVVAVPTAAFLAWYAWLGSQASQTDLASLDAVPAYVIDAVGGAIGGLMGLPDAGRFVGLAALVVVVALLWNAASISRPTWVFLALGLTFWTATALTRAEFRDPTASRYLLPGAVFCLLIAASFVTRPPSFGRRQALLLTGMLTVALASSTIKLFDRGDDLRRAADVAKLELGVVEAAGPSADQTRTIALSGIPVTVGPYLNAVRRWGSGVGSSAATLATGSDPQRTAVDTAFLGVYRNILTPGEAPTVGLAPPKVVRVEGAKITRASDCLRLRALRGAASAVLVLPPAGIRVRASQVGPASVALRRLGPSALPVGSVAGGTVATLRAPEDALPYPWYAKVRAPNGAEVCAASAAAVRG